ncbi:hypothetical protein DFH29DRAFT_1068513 [Suillus ampliporus]|nr:hypothetical protein DFH29DRAFT_1068513 [Suillus ampliporus]
MRFFFLTAVAALTASLSVGATPAVFNRDTQSCLPDESECTSTAQCCNYCFIHFNFEKDSQDAEELARHEILQPLGSPSLLNQQLTRVFNYIPVRGHILRYKGIQEDRFQTPEPQGPTGSSSRESYGISSESSYRSMTSESTNHSLFVLLTTGLYRVEIISPACHKETDQVRHGSFPTLVVHATIDGMPLECHTVACNWTVMYVYSTNLYVLPNRTAWMMLTLNLTASSILLAEPTNNYYNNIHIHRRPSVRHQLFSTSSVMELARHAFPTASVALHFVTLCKMGARIARLQVNFEKDPQDADELACHEIDRWVVGNGDSSI